MEIKQQGRFGQFFCKHKKSAWYKAEGSKLFLILTGEKHYRVCRDCGKILDTILYQHEGNGFK